jgi:cysteine-rich repeat protein
MSTARRVRLLHLLGRCAAALTACVFGVALLVGLAADVHAATATVTSLGSGVSRVVQGRIAAGSIRTYGFVGSLHIRVDGGTETDAYCVDLHDEIRIGDSEPQAPSDYPCEVVYVLNNTFPNPNTIAGRLFDRNREAAAVQAAIWRFTDDFTVTSPADIVGRAEQIIDAARARCGTVPVVPQTMTLMPPSAINYLPESTSHSVTATVIGTDGNPRPGQAVDVTITGAAGPQSFHGSADDAGRLTVAYDNPALVTGTDTVVARATFTVPVGLKFKRTGKQGIVLAGQPRPGSVAATATKNWAPARCGDGVRNQSGELCDDGNVIDGDGCDDNCTPTGCGNGIVTAGEECDDGNAASGDGCDVDCTLTRCGNGIVSIGEECDDGNAVDGDGCDANCTVSRCGNGVVTAGEECDDGNLVNGDSCDANCTVPRCGNGIVDAGEACDDGNAVDGDGCDTNCTIPACGNGIVTAGEECDDGNQVDGDGCDANCTVTRCGNGVVTLGEECDDGNTADGDGCAHDCVIARCGNGILEFGEECDDGNTAADDGCSAECRVEERCTNLHDDDGDGLIDCEDPDCPTCEPIRRDPATITFKHTLERATPDMLRMHGSIVPKTPIDPIAEGLGMVLSNANGVVYRAFLLPGDLSGKSTTHMWFIDRTAGRGRGVRDGIYRISIARRGERCFFSLLAYGDLRAATLPTMTVQVMVGDDVFFYKSEWKRTAKGWKTDFHFPFGR